MRRWQSAEWRDPRPGGSGPGRCEGLVRAGSFVSLLQPFGCAEAHRQVADGLVLGCAVPVLLAGRGVHEITDRDRLHRAVARSDTSAAVGDVQELPLRVTVPV